MGEPDLSVELAGLRLRNPVMLAAGILGLSAHTLKRAYDAGAGAVVTKSIGPEPRAGFTTPILVELDCGLLNAVGLSNPGADYFAREIQALRADGVPVVASVFGFRPEDYALVASRLAEAGAVALELNVSCPHVSGVREIGSRPELVEEVVRAVRETVDVPVFVKLSPNVSDIAEIGLAAERAGADGVVAINTVRALAIDIELRRPILSAGFGGLSGPAIKPIAVRAVAELYRALDVPVVGCGGVMGWRDAVELILAGASAIQVGSAVYYRGLGVFRAITSGLAAYMERMGYSSVADMVGDGVRELMRGQGA